MSRTWNTRIEQNIYLPPKSYSPWSPVPLYHQPLSLTQNFHRTVLLCWEGWNISLILFPLSCETHRQFDYNLSNNWWFVIFNCFKIMFQMSQYQWLHMVRNLEYVWKISFRISAGAKRDHESPLHTCHHSYNTMAFLRKEDPEGTYSSFKIFLMQTILIHTFSRLLAFRLFP